MRKLKAAGRTLAGALDRARTRVASTPAARSWPAQLAVRIIRELNRNDATHMAASISYYSILSLFPIILGVSALVGLVASSPDRQKQILDFVTGYIPGSEEFVRNSINSLVNHRGAVGVLSIIGLLWTGSAVFGSITRAVNRAWNVERNPPFYKNRPRQLAMGFGIALLFAFSIGVTSVLRWATSIKVGGRPVSDALGGDFVAVLLQAPAFLITLLIFLAIYKFIPNVRTFWRDIWPGAVIAAAMFEIAKNLFLWYLKTFGQYYDQLYGNIASVVVLMLWTYISALILIVGATIASEYSRMRKSIPERVNPTQVPDR